MQVLYPNDLKARRQQRLRQYRRQRRKRFGVRLSFSFLAIIVLFGGVGMFAFTRPVEAVPPSLVALPGNSIAPLSLPWPRGGQAAIGAVGHGVLDERGTETPRPIASTAKILTGLLVMKAKPLQPGQEGPMLTFSAHDERVYHHYVGRGGAVYPVTAGEQISQRKALEALLVMSANNIADMLAVWAYGSMEAYVKAANEYVTSEGLANMTIADASGFSPKTVGTARDLVQAGQLLMNDSVLSAIVAQRSINIPGTGAVDSTNVLLGGDGVIGIKTGNTDEAGGCFVIAMRHRVDKDHEVTLLAAVMGAQDVRAAMDISKRLVVDARTGFAVTTIVPADTVVAQYQTPWAGSVEATTTADLKALTWLPGNQTPQVALNAAEHGIQGSVVGEVFVDTGVARQSVPVALKSTLQEPGWQWRIYRRYF